MYDPSCEAFPGCLGNIHCGLKADVIRCIQKNIATYAPTMIGLRYHNRRNSDIPKVEIERARRDCRIEPLAELKA